MGIGYHVKKYQAEKAAAEAAQQESEPMAIVDPKDYMSAPEPSLADILTAMKDMIAMVAQARTAPEQDAAQKQIELMERLINKTRPENPDSPMISVYSRPRGERDDPKPSLKCPMFWVGYDLRTDTLTPEEIDQLNQLQPGEFRVTKADGTKIPFKVEAKYADQYDESTGRFKVEKLNVWFPTKGDHRQNHGSMLSYLRQVLHGSIPTADELLVELAKLKAELAAAKTGLVGAV